MRRHAFSLLEVIISLAIITVLMVGLFQAWLSMRSYSSQQTAAEDLVLESRRLVEEIVTDLGASTWYVPGSAPPENGPDTSDPTNNELADPSLDRQIRYYPYVQVQSAVGIGSEFAAHDRTGTGQFIDPAAPPPAMLSLPSDHYQWSQEIIFLKVRTSPASAAATTPARSMEPIDFDVPPPSIADFRARRNDPPDASTATTGRGGGVGVPGIRLNLDASGVVVDTPLVWDSHAVAPTPDQYREYTYVVVPNPVTGKGRLERHYRNGCTNASAASEPLRLDKILSEHVDRIRFDTYRTLASLNLNQVRVTIWLSREIVAQPGVFLTHRVEVTAALRSTSDGLNPVDLQSRLGPGGAFGIP